MKHPYSTRYMFWCGVELGQRLIFLLFFTALPKDTVGIIKILRNVRSYSIVADSTFTDDIIYTVWIHPTIQD